MPRPRFENLAPEKREAILGAAFEEFAAHGFDGASYNQIIEKTGISKGAMYYYFDDKEDLYATVVRAELADLLAEFHVMPTVDSADAFWEALTQFVDRAQAFVLDHPQKMRLVRSVWKLKADGLKSPIMKEIQAMAQGFSEQMILQGQALGAVRTDLPFDLLVGVVTAVDDAGDRWLVEKFEELEPDDFKKWALSFVDLLKRMLAP